jgi:hypothetical protein
MHVYFNCARSQESDRGGANGHSGNVDRNEGDAFLLWVRADTGERESVVAVGERAFDGVGTSVIEKLEIGEGIEHGGDGTGKAADGNDDRVVGGKVQVELGGECVSVVEVELCGGA